MIEVTQTIVVAKPLEDVFAFWADHSNNTRWQLGQKRCEWTSDGPIGVGSTYEQEASFLGRPIISRFECTEFEPDRRIRIVTTESTMPLDITREVSRTDDGRTRLVATIRGGSDGWSRLFDPLTRRMVARTTAKDYRRLAELLDS